MMTHLVDAVHFSACFAVIPGHTPIFIQLIHNPERKVIIKHGQKAAEYFAYCEEDYE